METPFVVCSARAFRAQLRRERERVDRHGGGFSLVIVDLRGSGDGERTSHDLQLRIQRMMRALDLLGWLDPARLGVLLPATTLQGAMTFTAHLRSTFPRGARIPPIGVLAYPDYWKEVMESLDDHDGSRAALEVSAAEFSELFLSPVPAWKRGIDLAGAALGLAVLFPLLVLIALYIKAVSPGPVLFRQRRVGRAGRTFTFLKFRTMRPGAGDGAHRALLQELIHGGSAMTKLDRGRDPRVIPGGGFLRSTSLDELPQLLNVLRGDMSLVGPRPSIPYEAREFAPWHTHRFDALPGMTGLWQVSGKNRLSFEEMVRLDIAYAGRLSVLRDAAILLRTVPTLVALAGEAIIRRLPRGLEAATAGGRSLGDG